jgi:hypothetical protein
LCAVVECTPADRWFDGWEGNGMSRKPYSGWDIVKHE